MSENRSRVIGKRHGFDVTAGLFFDSPDTPLKPRFMVFTDEWQTPQWWEDYWAACEGLGVQEGER